MPGGCSSPPSNSTENPEILRNMCRLTAHPQLPGGSSLKNLETHLQA